MTFTFANLLLRYITLKTFTLLIYYLTHVLKAPRRSDEVEVGELKTQMLSKKFQRSCTLFNSVQSDSRAPAAVCFQRKLRRGRRGGFTTKQDKQDHVILLNWRQQKGWREGQYDSSQPSIQSKPKDNDKAPSRESGADENWMEAWPCVRWTPGTGSWRNSRCARLYPGAGRDPGW